MADDWVFFHACGHPFGVMIADAHSTTERRAWDQFYWTEKDRRAAEDCGVTCRRVDHDTYVAEWSRFLRDGCDCPAEPVDESGAPHGTCTVCGRDIRLKADGTLFHHGGAPQPVNFRRRPYRCDGAGKLSAETKVDA